MKNEKTKDSKPKKSFFKKVKMMISLLAILCSVVVLIGIGLVIYGFFSHKTDLIELGALMTFGFAVAIMGIGFWVGFNERILNL